MSFMRALFKSSARHGLRKFHKFCCKALSYFKGQSDLWDFRKVRFWTIIRLVFTYNKILASKNLKPSAGYDFSPELSDFDFLKNLTHKWKFWSMMSVWNIIDIDLEVLWKWSTRFWKAHADIILFENWTYYCKWFTYR